jgi:hypothetical protein
MSLGKCIWSRFLEFVEIVERATDVPANEQEYFFNYSSFKGKDYPNVSMFPMTKEENPLILYGGDCSKAPLKYLYLRECLCHGSNSLCITDCITVLTAKVPQLNQTAQIDLTEDDHMAKVSFV